MVFRFPARGCAAEGRLAAAARPQLDRRMPTRTSCTAMHFEELARQRIPDGVLEGQVQFDGMQDTMTRAASEWDEMTAAAKVRI